MNVVSALILDAQKRTLITLRRPSQLRPDMWEYPGGKVEDRESREDALRRELDEELGVRVYRPALVDVLHLRVEVQIDLHLYHVEVHPATPPFLREAAGMIHVHPLDAVLHYPCMPSMYLLYTAVTNYIAAL